MTNHYMVYIVEFKAFKVLHLFKVWINIESQQSLNLGRKTFNVSHVWEELLWIFFLFFFLLFLVNARIFGTLFLKLSPDLQNLNSKKMSVAKPDTQINHTFPFITVTSLFNWLFICWNVIFLVHRYICYMFIQFLMSRWQNFVVKIAFQGINSQ